MTRRELFAGGIGAALTAAVFVALECWPAGGQGTGVLHPGAASPMSGETSTAAASAPGPPDQAWRTANANLAETVRRTQERLDRNEGEKKELERQLREAKAKLAAAQDGGAPPRNEFDLTQDDWKQLARTGTVKARYPCDFDHDWSVTPEQGARLGLSPSDVPPSKGRRRPGKRASRA